MYKYVVDYLGGETDIDKTNSKARAIQRIKERFRVKPYLTARLKTNMTARASGYWDYREIARYQMKFDPKTGKHRFEEV